MPSSKLASDALEQIKNQKKVVTPVCFLGGYLALLGILLSNAYAATIITTDYRIPYKHGQQLHLKEKKLSTSKTGKSGKVIVLINPLSIPALRAFDVPGYSLMDALADKGYDVWGAWLSHDNLATL